MIIMPKRGNGPHHFTLEQRVFMVLQYSKTRSPSEVIQQFQLRFPNTRRPSRNTPIKLYKKYQQEGTSSNLHKKYCGRPRSARSPVNIDAVRRALENNPRISTRRNPIPDITRSSFNRITRLDLRWHPYVMERRHALRPEDLRRRLQFCQWLVGRPEGFLSDVLIGDEATFLLNEKVNTHNIRLYAPKGNPPQDFSYDRVSRRGKLVVWVGLMGNGLIIGPVIIRQYMNAQKYLDVINDAVGPELLANPRYQQNADGSISRVWWIQDGASCHRTRAVRERLTALFPDRVVGIGHAVEYPPRSPDLTPLDFFLWGYIKSKVYTTPPADIEELERRIRVEIAALRRSDLPGRTVEAMRSRAARCIAVGGRHVEGRARIHD